MRKPFNVSAWIDDSNKMVDRQKALLMVLIALLIYPNDIFGGAFPPEFADSIQNVTVSLGRDATFTCLVNHLGGYRVGWLKVNTKAIQAIHDHVITHNNRVSVSHSDHTTWNLHIKSVQKEDEGLYMCQINTDPMKSQVGMLSIVVPPDFIPEETSSDVMVREGGQVKLTCHARGVPPPSISWRREDGKNIIIRKPFAGTALNQKSHVTSVSEYHGEDLKLTKILRNEMGVYLCIAINGVPPAVSKRISINVHSMIISSQQHDVQMIEKSKFEVRMLLTIRNLQKDNVGTYKCVAKNSLGDVESSIRLYEISGPTKTQTAARPSFYDEEDETVYGSAEMEKMDNKPLSVDNTINGHAGYPSVATPAPTTRIGKKRTTIHASSNANSHRRATDLLIVLMLIVAQSQGRQ